MGGIYSLPALGSRVSWWIHRKNGQDRNELLLVSGFWDGWVKCTPKVFALDTTKSKTEWQWLSMDDLPMDDVPKPNGTEYKSKTGISQAAFVIVKDVFYMCGGYVGGNPGQETTSCFKYNHSITPGNGDQWSRFAGWTRWSNYGVRLG
jgi:hypothetical protein